MKEGNKTACSARLLRAAKKAARASAIAKTALNEWATLFEEEYGHNDISDPLVEVIDYSTGNVDLITREFIAENSEPGGS